MNESLAETASLYVLDRLDARKRAAFDAHLLREPELAAFVHELEATLARSIRTLPPSEPPADLINRIEARIDAPPEKSVPFPSSVLRPLSSGLRSPWAAAARWGIAAVIAVSLGILAVQSLRRPAQPVFVIVGLDGTSSTFADLPQSAGAKDPDARFIQLASLADDYWRNPATRPGKPVPALGDSRGYALFDPASREGFIAIEQLPVLTASQRYHLWVADVSSGRVRDAGTLPLASLNRGLYSFALEPGDAAKADRPQFFVTAEDIGAVEQAAGPRGKVVLGQRSF